MTITIINDCRDANAAGRQVARFSSFFAGMSTHFIGVSNDLEAAGNLIDALDALEDRQGIVAVNVAPRHGKAKQWPNGTPFGYFRYRQALIVSTIDGATLSLVKKFGLVSELHVLDLPQTLSLLAQQGEISTERRVAIEATQFRSYEFVPLVAACLAQGKDVVSSPLAIATVEDVANSVWWVDCFGNCKTTLLAQEMETQTGGTITSRQGTFAFHARLKDVPDAQAAFIEGSSGLGDRRFLELVVQGGRADERFGLRSGDRL